MSKGFFLTISLVVLSSSKAGIFSLQSERPIIRKQLPLSAYVIRIELSFLKTIKALLLRVLVYYWEAEH